MKNKAQRRTSIDLGLEVIETVRKPGQRLTCKEIAAVCGCTGAAIYWIEKSALAKLRRAMARREVTGGIEG